MYVSSSGSNKRENNKPKNLMFFWTTSLIPNVGKLNISSIHICIIYSIFTYFLGVKILWKRNFMQWYKLHRYKKYTKIRIFTDPYSHACILGSKKCSFFVKFGAICFLVTPVSRFALLPIYRRFFVNPCNLNTFYRN